MTADSFSRNIGISVGAHVVVLLLIFFRAVNAPTDRLDIRNAIRVDVVGLPMKAQQLPDVPVEKPAPAPPVKAHELPKKVETSPVKTEAPVVPNPKAQQKNLQKAQKKALDKLKAMEALENLKNEVAKEKAAKPSAVAGNQVSPGNSLTGLARLEFDRYFDELQAKVLAAWNIPTWLADQDLKAEIEVAIDDRGFLIRKVIRKSSGNSVFDAKMLEAIDQSSPFPPPPQRLRGTLSSGIVFKFPQ